MQSLFISYSITAYRAMKVQGASCSAILRLNRMLVAIVHGNQQFWMQQEQGTCVTRLQKEE